ncbi:MAG: hypothetical protein HUJ31_10635, partial [Pseudomonadales bacterium]|nr:hypothetical protein [Pseudomonadales bacterium]
MTLHPENDLLLTDDQAACDRAQVIVDAARLFEPDPDFERSVKFSAKGIDYNRFLLGLDGRNLTVGDINQVCQTLAMPTNLRQQAGEAFESPSTVLLGFEHRSGEVIYKLYFEFWDQVVSQVHGEVDPHAPVLLNLGFKWNVDVPDRQVVTRYTCLPLLDLNRILARITKITDDTVRGACRDIVTRSAHKLARPTFVYMEAEEGNDV